MNAATAAVPVAQQPLDRRKVMLASGGLALCLALAIFVVLRLTMWAEATASDASRSRVVVDAETGEVVQAFHIEDNSAYPWVNPKTGKKTLYPPEHCYWTKDGNAKLEPTYVLLNEIAGKPGKTFCPDCGREVVIHNPLPPSKLLQEAAAAAKKK